MNGHSIQIIPHSSEIKTRCLVCPSGNFSGSYGVSDISVCESTTTNTIASRILLSLDKTKLTRLYAMCFFNQTGQIEYSF